MFGKLFVIFALFAYEGLCLTEIRLEDRKIDYIRNEYFGPSPIAIPKLWIDTLTNCHIIFPNGVMYEVFPTNQMPTQNIYFMRATIPEFQNCGVAFSNNIATSYSGTYELVSTVQHSEDSYISVTRQKNHLVIRERT